MMHSVRAVTVCEPFCVRVHKYIFVLDSNILRFSYLSTKRSESFIRINPQSYPFFFSFYSPISFSSCSMRAPQFIKTGNSAEENMHRKRKKTTINEQLLRQNQKFVGKKTQKKHKPFLPSSPAGFCHSCRWVLVENTWKISQGRVI